MVLSNYILSTRRLLNDANSSYWQDEELKDYINEARRQVSIDTSCVRAFQLANLIVGQDKYLYENLLPNGAKTVDILNVTLIWGTSRIPLRWYPFTIFSAYYRFWTVNTQFPLAFTLYGPNILWIAPVPNQVYSGEFDTAVVADPLVDDDDPDLLRMPYDDAVKFWAAKLAKLRMQQYAEAKAQDALYMQAINKYNSMYPRRIPTVYAPDDIS